LNQNINFYNDNAEQLTEQYKSVQANVVHGSWAQLLLQFNESTKTALDIGAGSGRDASWLANHNFKVTAVEPANKLLTQAQINFPHKNIQWLNDSLPSLKTLDNERCCFDVILVSAVWMHLSPINQHQSLKRLIPLINPHGLLVITLRIGNFDDGRTAYPFNADELIEQAKQNSLRIKVNNTSNDEMGRSNVTWQTLVFEKDKT
jgi:2-polyprenyl-3-methyl-5-hydroxy-6-metoxy-1,4-benzoquinol methylase